MKRTESAQQLQRQIDVLMSLCGAQLERIRKRQRENEKLRRQLAAIGGRGRVGGGGRGV